MGLGLVEFGLGRVWSGSGGFGFGRVLVYLSLFGLFHHFSYTEQNF